MKCPYFRVNYLVSSTAQTRTRVNILAAMTCSLDDSLNSFKPGPFSILVERL